ncbi:beta-ketoacyl-[acyl-carrier-protein] synthase II, partial [Clostridium saudiense]|nr:beta-ketoacyl-[acyl-carrier-protein] synthase II [Clostridium saudiense]
MKRRVVVTGIGAITPIGNSANEFWNNVKANKNGIDQITYFDTSDFKVKLAAEVKNFNVEDYIGKKDAKRMDKYTQFAIIASNEA